MLLTFGQLKQGPCSRISGVCVDNPEFADVVNQATRQIMRRGNWWGTVQIIRGCAYDECVTWPACVGTVLAIDQNCRRVEVANRWYQFLTWESGWFRNYRLGGPHEHRAAVFEGTSPVFSPVPAGMSNYILAYPNVQDDAGKTITIFGYDSNGQFVRTNNGDGTWSDGVKLTLAMPYVVSPQQFQKVTRVLKDATQGVVRLYQWDGASTNPDGSPLLLDMAQYNPSETSPAYNVSRVPRTCGQIVALVKLAFSPVSSDSDLVLIDNEEALANMIQSIRYREKGDPDRAIQWEKDAFRELNYELRDRFPQEQFNLNFKPFGNDELIKQRIGYML